MAPDLYDIVTGHVRQYYCKLQKIKLQYKLIHSVFNILLYGQI